MEKICVQYSGVTENNFHWRFYKYWCLMDPETHNILLGCEENDSLSRKKTLLSLSKLSYLADGQDPNSENINSLNRNLDIITYQVS